MVDLNISVKVLNNKAPYLLVWWNEKADCADGFLVTCSCQGYQLNRSPSCDSTSTESHGDLSVALREAEIMTIHPTRIGRSLCREVDVMTVEEIKMREREAKSKRSKKRKNKRKKKGVDLEKDQLDDFECPVADEINYELQEEQQSPQPSGGSQQLPVEAELLSAGEAMSEIELDPSQDRRAGDISEGREEFSKLSSGMIQEVPGMALQTAAPNSNVASTEILHIKDIPTRTISEVIKELFPSSDVNQDNNVVADSKGPQNDISVPMAVADQTVTTSFPLPSLPAATYIKDLSDPKNAAEWEYLQRLKDEKFLAKCNKKQRRFIHFVLCEVCGAALCSKTYQNHLDAQHNRSGIQRKPEFACRICNKKFLYAAHVSRHELIHQNVRFQCQFCPKSFSQAGACRSHEKTHSNGPHGELARLEQRLKSTSERMNPWVRCLECDKQVRKRSMKKHMEVHDPSIPPPEPICCQLCGKVYSSKASLAQHMKLHSEKEHACEVCGKKFHQKLNLTTHMRIHTKERPIPCRYCGERFSRHQARLNHERMQHTGEKPYYCHVCVKSWRDRVTFTQHMKRNHPEEPIMTLKKKPPQILHQQLPQTILPEHTVYQNEVHVVTNM